MNRKLTAKQSPGIFIIAGGTGGHIFPALAVAEQLSQHGYAISWLGARYGLEAKLVPDKYPIEYIAVQGMRRRGWLAKCWAPWRLLRATWQAYRILRRQSPQAVLAMGGYVAAPGGCAAWLLRIPLVIHEQNAKAGLTNRLLAKIATVRLQAFDQAFSASIAVATVGNPVRATLMTVPLPEQRYVLRAAEPLRILILGGSQGAHAINQCMLDVWRQLPQSAQIAVWHQTGERDFIDMQQQYQSLPMRVTVEPFIHDMAQAYAWADLVICRAGAMTISELAVVGVASILVPYPYAVDDHQVFNAQYLSNQQAGILLTQEQLSAPAILTLIEQFMGNRHSLLLMAQAAKKLAHPQAAEIVAQQVCLVAEK